MSKKIFHIIILGPQGSGKGTQAKILAEKFNLAHVETGKILRNLAKQKSAMGGKINYLINQQGRLIASAFVAKVLKYALRKVKPAMGLIFDGYPRNLVQAKFLDRILRSLGRQLTHVFYLPISQKTTIRRLSLRRTCAKCGRIFTHGVDAKKNSRCSACGGQLIQRPDDQPAAIARRLRIYQSQTRPVVDFYKNKGLLVRINGEPPISRVTKEVMKFFN